MLDLQHGATRPELKSLDGWARAYGTEPGQGGRTRRVLAAGQRAPSQIITWDTFVAPLAPDADGNGLPTDWELTWGLDPTDAGHGSGVNDDPDGDGKTNLMEYQEGTHPRGFFTRYLAEGATGSFFKTRLALLSPDAGEALVHLQFLADDGTATNVPVVIRGRSRTTIDVAALPGLESASFSTVISSDKAVIVDRTMTWDHTGYGSHAETSIASPSTIWYLAEGSTSGDFSLFYLLQNPNAVTVTATIRYLLPFGAPIERDYTLPPRSRRTIAIDGEGPELASTDVSGVITATAPIIAERSMYFSKPDRAFTAGHGSAGVTAPATHWFLAEGATGPFFDLFILLANPSADTADVSIDYLLSSGEVVTKAYSLPASSRTTIWADDEQIPAGSGQRPLANVAVSSSITSTNGVPIIVERSMWWPGPEISANFWTEAHNSAGATATGTRWALAEGEVGGADGAETYVLIANTSAFAGRATVTLLFEDGTTASKSIALGARSRTTVNVSADFPTAAGKRFGALVESEGTTPPQIVVERAMYTSPGGQTWAAGTNALGTTLH